MKQRSPKIGPAPKAPRPELMPDQLWGKAAQARVAPTGTKVPRPELLPPAMRAMVGQPRIEHAAGAQSSGTPRPARRPGMRTAPVVDLRRVAQARPGRGVVTAPVGRSIAPVRRLAIPGVLQRSKSEESAYPSSFTEIAQAAAFSKHTLDWLAGVLQKELPEAEGPEKLAKAVRRAFKYSVPDAYIDKKMPTVKLQQGEKAAEGYVYGTPNNPETWSRQAADPTIRAMIQPNIANTSDLTASLKAMYKFVHKQSRSPAKYKYLEGDAKMEIDPILIYIRIPDGPSDTYADFSYLDEGVYQHVVSALVPFYYPFGSFHLSVNPLSSKVTSLSAALSEAVKLVASKTSNVTAADVAETWYKLCLGQL